MTDISSGVHVHEGITDVTKDLILVDHGGERYVGFRVSAAAEVLSRNGDGNRPVSQPSREEIAEMIPRPDQIEAAKVRIKLDMLDGIEPHPEMWLIAAGVPVSA